MEHPLIQIARMIVAQMAEQDDLAYAVLVVDQPDGRQKYVLTLDGQPVEDPDNPGHPLEVIGDPEKFLTNVFLYSET